MVEYSMFGDKNKMLRGDKNDNKNKVIPQNQFSN